MGCDGINLYGLFCLETYSLRLETSVTIVSLETYFSNSVKIFRVIFIGVQTKIMLQDFIIFKSEETFGDFFLAFLIVSCDFVTANISKSELQSALNIEPPMSPSPIIPIFNFFPIFLSSKKLLIQTHYFLKIFCIYDAKSFCKFNIFKHSAIRIKPF